MTKYRMALTGIILLMFPLVSAPAAAHGPLKTFRAHLQWSRTQSVTATVATEPMPRDYLYRHRTMWGGHRGDSARRIITRIAVHIGSTSQYIPLSAYADLGDPAQVYLEPISDGRFRLVIHGSDAGGAYTAFFYFKQGDLDHRRVVSGEFPSQVWEDTHYGFIPSNSRM